MRKKVGRSGGVRRDAIVGVGDDGGFQSRSGRGSGRGGGRHFAER